MGKNNRLRRAAKQRQRRKVGATPGPQESRRFGSSGWLGDSPDERDLQAALVAAIGADLTAAASGYAAGNSDAPRRSVADLLRADTPIGAETVAQIAESLLGELMSALASGGWQPVDMAQVTARRLGASHLDVLAVVLGAHAAGHPRSRIHPDWLAQISELGPPPDRPGILGAAASRSEEVPVLIRAVELMGVLKRLPLVTPILPAPGSYSGAAPPLRAEESKVLGRVRALLSKAESTEFPDEAEALTAKAQALMSRHSLERLVQQDATGEVEPVTTTRLWLEAPYLAPKALLVDAIATANRCRAVWSEALGCVTLMGTRSDLAAVALLTTSLLVQATRAMLHTPRAAGGATRSFRQSFLVSFATRIGERLDGAADAAVADMAQQSTRSLLPVLRSASERVESAFAEAFPALVTKSISVSNGHGWVAGRAAADLARLDATPQVTQARAG